MKLNDLPKKVKVSRRSFIVGSAAVGGGIALGLRMPHDISLVSIGRADFILNHVPAISTLRVDYEKLSEEITARLFERLANGSGRKRPLRRLFPYVFEVRGSSTAPPDEP